MNFLKNVKVIARLYKVDNIKNYLSWDNLSPLNRLLSSTVNAGCSPGFKEILIEIFVGMDVSVVEHSCMLTIITKQLHQ